MKTMIEKEIQGELSAAAVNVTFSGGSGGNAVVVVWEAQFDSTSDASAAQSMDVSEFDSGLRSPCGL